MDLKQLEYFISVVDEGNISAAAKKLHMSQPPLSTQIHLLEDELNCVLFERGARKIQLTEAGSMLYNRAVTLLEMSELTKKELKDYSKGKKGVLRFGLVSSVNDFALDEWLIDFHKCYPDIGFDIMEANTYEFVDMLKANLIELAIIRAPFPEDGILGIPLKKEYMMAVGDQRYFDNDSDIIELKDLEGKPLIFYRRWKNTLISAFEKENISPSVFCSNNDARTTASWSDKGMGIGILPESAKILIKGDNTVMKIIKNESIASEIYIAVHKNSYHSEIAKTFIEFVKGKCGV